MCKFLLELFKKPVEPITSTSGTPVDVVATGETIDIPVTEDSGDTQENNIEEPETGETIMNANRIDVENRILDFEYDMRNGNARTVNQIAVHCTATKEGVEVTMDDIDRWHKERGFTKQKISGHYCGYHFVVALDGTIMCGRDLREVGAHVSGYNSKSIGVCYVGGLDRYGKEKDTRTPEQKESLIWLIGELKHILRIQKVQGHRDYSPDTNGNGIIESFEWIKSCPCFNAIPEYKDL